jgi:arylsulfatase A-like enzyme
MRARSTLLALLALAWLPACEEAQFGGAAPNVVLISVDTLRADALSPYGGPVVTPTFERLAREGVLFERAYAPAPETAPSHASLLTGQRVLRHGVTGNGLPLAGQHETLAEAFRRQGYATAAFVSSWVLDPRFGWSQGFDVYDATFPDEGATMDKADAYPGAIWVGRKFRGLDRRAVETTLAAERWLRDAPEPFFLFVHYFDPHRPYVPPPSFAQRVRDVPFDVSGRHFPGLSPHALLGVARGYQAEVLYLDDSLGELLAAVDARTDVERTLVVMTADHGEGLGDHGWLEHGVNLHDEQLHVPLVFRWRGRLPAGRRIETPLSVRVVAPTIADLAWLGEFEPPGGRSIAEDLRAGREPESLPVFAQRRPHRATDEIPEDVLKLLGPAGRTLAVRHGRWKLIRSEGAPPELYDVESDPDETRNVSRDHPELARELSALIDELIAENPPPPEPAALEPEVTDKLRALGYAD